MIYLVILFGIVFFTLIIRGCKDAFSKLVLIIFGAFWIFSLIGSQFKIQGLFLPKDSTIMICLVGILFFILGYLSVVISPRTAAHYKPSILEKSINKVLNSVFFRVSLIVMTLFVISQDILMYNMIFINASVAAGDLRGSAFGEESFYSPLFLLSINLLFCWYIPVIRALFCYSLFFKRDKYTIIMFLLLFGYAILDAGRFGFIRALIPIIAVIGLFQYVGGKTYLQKTQKKVLWYIVGVAFFFVFVVSALRQGSRNFSVAVEEGWNATTEQIVSYSIGPIVALDCQINSGFVNNIGGYKYGSISLWPFTTPYFRFQTPYIGINPNYVRYREESEQNRITIGGNLAWNGLYTWNLNFYCDGGVLGVILLNFLFGFLMRFCIKWTYRQKTISSFILCTLVLSFVVQAPLKLSDYSVLDPVLIIALIILSKIESSKGVVYNKVAIKKY